MRGTLYNAKPVVSYKLSVQPDYGSDNLRYFWQYMSKGRPKKPVLAIVVFIYLYGFIAQTDLGCS